LFIVHHIQEVHIWRMNMYDVVVIGAGVAGCDVANLLAKGGKRVCLIDKSEQNVGGTCLNEGCIPAKNFLETANWIQKSDYFKSCGANIVVDNFDIDALKSNTQNLISLQKNGIFTTLKKNKVDIKYGVASFIDKNSIQIVSQDNSEILKAKDIVISTGSIHRDHPTISLYEDKIISSKEVFELKQIPKSILIIGGGAIGCEFAIFFNALGVDVDISEFTPNLIPTEDIDISKALKRELEKKSIKVYLNSNITQCDINNNGIDITIDMGKKLEQKRYDKVLISIGRVPNTKDLNLEKLNIKTKNDFILVDDNLRVQKYENIYAIGDTIPTAALAHTASYEAKRVARLILQKDTLVKDTIFPSVIFSTPQVASVGKSEKELKQNDIKYKAKKHFFKSSSKAKIKGDDSGYIKIIYDEVSEQILGASIIGNDATELIHQFLIIINTQLTLSDISKMIFAHPTLSESIMELTSS